MDHFLAQTDELAALINEQAITLMHQLESLPVTALKLPKVPLEYYLGRHQNRKFFSVQTAAELLYRSLKLKNIAVSNATVMDYGGGLGSLFLLAKMIGCKTVIYNDIRADMAEAAQIISNYLKISIDYFIAGDHKQTLSFLKEKDIHCDIILSRNVVEHIYDLKDFYRDMSALQPNALIYFSTTANYHNPGNLWYHRRIHRHFEKEYLSGRKERIKKLLPDIAEDALSRLGAATRGLALQDLENAIENYKISGAMPDPSVHHTNTTDPNTGVWAEHVIPKWEYQDIIRSCGYRLTIIPAFWDTHYKSPFKNVLGKTMNYFTKILGPKAGLWTTAFIYVIAEPNKS